MADVDLTLKSVLSGLGVNVYALQRPADSPLPALVYQRISEKNYMVHSGWSDTARTRFQITHVASTYSGLRSLVNSVETALLGNQTNFKASTTPEVHIESKEADSIFVAQKDYFIWL